MERWSGKIAVVTGASAGIGAEIAKDLVKAGLIVIGFARRPEKIDELRDELKSAPGQLHSVHCDVSDYNSVKKAFSWVDSTFGVINILINNAGIYMPDIPILSDEDNFNVLKRIIDTNFSGLVACTQEAFKIIKKSNEEGHIVNINSTDGHWHPANIPPFYKSNVYPATKHAVTVLTEVIRQELNDMDTVKIRVTSISPGAVNTDIFTTPNEQLEAFFATAPYLNPSDISSAVLYAIGTPPHVNVQEMIVRPVGERF